MRKFSKLFLLLLVVLTACARTQVQTTQSEVRATLPRPASILVYDFAVSAEEVKLNSGLAAKIKGHFSSEPKQEQQYTIGKAVSNALADELVKQLQALGLPAQRAYGPSARGNVLLITGQFLDVDQGNRLRRMVIGFGTGSSRVDTLVQVSDVSAPPGHWLLSFKTTAKSSIRPGMGPMTGVGAAVGHAATSAAVSGAIATAGEVFGAQVQDDAKRTAKEIVKQLVPYFQVQGWIAAKK